MLKAAERLVVRLPRPFAASSSPPPTFCAVVSSGPVRTQLVLLDRKPLLDLVYFLLNPLALNLKTDEGHA